MPQRPRRPSHPRPRHHFDWRTPWLQIFMDEMRERALGLASRERRERPDREDDFLDQAEDAERLFAGFPKDWGNDDCLDDDCPPYLGDIDM